MDDIRTSSLGLGCRRCAAPSGSHTVAALHENRRSQAPAGPVGAVDGFAAAPVINIAALAALPATAHTAIVNVTAVNNVDDGAGFISLYPCTSATVPPPNVSTLNFTTGSIVANGALTGLSNGQACVWVYGGTDAIIDVADWFVNGRRDVTSAVCAGAWCSHHAASTPGSS